MATKKTGVKTKLAIVRPSVIATTFSARSTKFAKQQRLNAIMAGVYAVQAIALLVIGRSASAPVSVSYLAKDPLQSAALHRPVFMLAQHHLFDISLLALLVTLLLGWAVFHVLLATVFRERYERGLAAQLNDLRWTGIGVLGALLTLVAGFALGVSDIAIAVAIVALCVLMAYGAMAVEANKKFWPWSIFVAVAGVGLTIALGVYLVGNILYGDGLPAATYGAALIPLLGGVAVAANLWLQIRAKRQWKEYLFAETAYMGVGFIATTALVWLTCVGVLR